MSNPSKLSVAILHPPWNMLRPVREQSLEFIEMVDSIREHGVLNSILVRPHPVIPNEFEIIDGMWRFLAAKHLTIPTLPCIIKECDDDQFLALQIQTNAITYETKPIEFAEQMQKVIRIRENVGAPITIKELAGIVNKSTAWVSQRLQLLRLCAESRRAMLSGKLNLGKAVTLSRIRSPKYQIELLPYAETMKNREFELFVGRFINERIHNKKLAEAQETRELLPRLQSMDNILKELDRLDYISEVIVRKNLTTATEGAIIALEWVLHLHEEGRIVRLEEYKDRMSNKERIELIGRRRYEELNELRRLREERQKQLTSKKEE